MMLEEGLVYLNHASVGPLPIDAKREYDKEINIQATVGEKKIDYEAIEDLWTKLRNNIAKLVNGSKEGVTITTNTGSGLHLVADGLHHKFKKGQNIIIPDIEFVTNSYVWQELAKRYQIELRTIPSKNNIISLDSWDKTIDDNTILIALSHVQFSNGYRSDLKQISEIAHDHGAYVTVDAIQSLGVVPFDVKYFDVDFVAAAGYKWLLGPYGTGLFYTKPELVEELDSILVGWFSTQNYKELAHQPFKPWKDARKFQQTMINPAMNAFNASLEVILNWEVKKSFEKVIYLQDLLIEEVEKLNDLTIGSSLKKDTRSGILKIDGKFDMKPLVSYLGSQDIIVAYRDRGIRVSPHAYNSKEDIQKLLNSIQNWMKKK